MKIMTFALICIGIAVALSLMVAVVTARVTVREMLRKQRKHRGDCHTSVRTGSQ